jgi:hypothetical protein
VKIVDDLLETFMLADLKYDAPHRVCRIFNDLIRDKRRRNSLNMTPIRVKMTSWEATKNPKYLATTARSNLEWVCAPWNLDNHLKIIGKTKAKRADSAGGRTPEIKANVPGEELAHPLITRD